MFQKIYSNKKFHAWEVVIIIFHQHFLSHSAEKLRGGIFCAVFQKIEIVENFYGQKAGGWGKRVKFFRR